MIFCNKVNRYSEVVFKLKGRKFFIFGRLLFAETFYMYCKYNGIEDNVVAFILSDIKRLKNCKINIMHGKPVNDVKWLLEHPDVNVGFLGVRESLVETDIRGLFEKNFVDMELFYVPDTENRSRADSFYWNIYDKLILNGFIFTPNKYENSNFNLRKSDSDNIYKYMLRTFQAVDDTEQLFFSNDSLDEKYKRQLGSYEYIDNITYNKISNKICTIYMAKSHVDRPLVKDFYTPYTKVIQVGASLTDLEISPVKDNVGDNVSNRNRDYCEMSAVYWAWKNDFESDYIGLCHYRRRFVITQDMINYFMDNNYDAVYTLPKITEEGIREEFVERNYFLLPETWDFITKAVEKVIPDYLDAWKEISKAEFLIPFNMCIMSREKFNDYCSVVFTLLKEVDSYYLGKGIQRDDRYLGYISEIFLTVYTMKNKDNLKKCYIDMIQLDTK